MPSKWRSIIQESPDRCYECMKSTNLVTHHVFRGPFRKAADEDGLFVRLCTSCHEHIHKYPKGEMNVSLRKEGQRKWMNYYSGTVEDFRKRFGRSVL